MYIIPEIITGPLEGPSEIHPFGYWGPTRCAKNTLINTTIVPNGQLFLSSCGAPLATAWTTKLRNVRSR